METLDAEIHIEDFKDETKRNLIKNQINKCVSEKTDNKITEIIDKISSDTDIIAVNAISFLNKWLKEYNSKEIKEFYISEIEKIETEFMVTEGEFSWIDEYDDFKALILPYKDKRISMIIIFPNDFNIQNIVKNLSSIMKKK